MQTPPVRASPISQLRSAISDSLVLDVRSSAFRRLPQCHPRQEPRNGRITRKWPATAILPACAWDVYVFRPLFYRPRRVFAEGDQHRMVTRPHGNVTSPAHFPVWFAAAGGEPNGESISECESPSAKKSPLTGSVIHCLRLPLPAHRGQAAYGVRELVTAFWPTPHPNHPVRASRSPNSDLRSPTPCVATAHLPGIRQS